MIFLIGSPRSGTSWLAKIFDSHPDVIYRHEPDSVVISQDIPFFPDPEEMESLIPATRDYFTKLLNVRQLKSAGSLPVFNKNYLGKFTNAFLPKLIFILKATAAICHKLRLPVTVKIPDFSRNNNDGKIIPVMKSVNSCCRTGLIARAFPQAKIIYILRHPCGYVSSQLRGRKLQFLEDVIYHKQIASTSLAKARGWSEAKLQTMSLEEQLACTWACINEKVMHDIEGQDNCTLLIYENLCNDPVGVCQQMFDFCQLNYTGQTESFLKSSLNYSGDTEKYYQTVRNPKNAAEKWKNELSVDQIKRIRTIVSGTIAGEKFASFYD
ncbi:MAG: sulfotransferase [Alphaproteobacteria bacterium]|nr:sulfotransferase [Alphaproteobacteria bacterium]